MVTHNTVFNPNPLQKRFIESRAKADLFSSRMGEGKSTALCWSAYYHTRHNPGASWVIIRDTFENLVATTQKSFFSWFPPGVFGTYNASKKCFTWAEGVAKGEVYFLGMDDQQDATKLMSREYGGFGMDEPAPAVGSGGIDEMVFDMAMSRLRQPGMKWYAAKLAENNPDESHWTYKKWVTERHQNPGFQLWQPDSPENLAHLPASYYAQLRSLWAHRPDLIRRFVDGEFGFQSVGRAVTPQWSDRLHLAIGLAPFPRRELVLSWDFGLNPTCIISQHTPSGHLNVLDAFVGDGIGVEELIESVVLPTMQSSRYKGLACPLIHTGDPNAKMREQSNSKRSALRSLKSMMPGVWKAGPVSKFERINPLQALLTRTINGKGVLQVDRDHATAVWYALRGGWHHKVSRAGVISQEPHKDIHSHPGDAMGYLAAYLFPTGKGRAKQSQPQALAPPRAGGYFGAPNPAHLLRGATQIGPGPGVGRRLPAH